MADDPKFKIGDTVRLKSGGPLMTVSLIVQMRDGSHEAATTWFDGQGKEMHSRFKLETLQADDGTPPAPIIV
jgi:uncharacterized protein YodC (DUF2158 family)